MQNRLRLLVAVALVAIFAAGVAAQDIIFILDASNSMNKDFDADTRIAAAKGALSQLLLGIPEGGNVGLMVYGHRINYENEVESCQDIALLFPLAPYTLEMGQSMIDSFRGINAQGKTPLADSLITASNELVNGGTIILVSDGEGNCGGQADVVAQMLATMQPPVILHVVGIDVDQGAGDELRNIALATGGLYWGVQDTDALLAALFEAVGPIEDEVVALPTIEPSGIPAQYACLGITNVIYGTEDDDTIYGTEENDLIFGYGGDDFLVGLDGNDVLIGGPGTDILEGVMGDDFLDGGDGADLLFGGMGNDLLCGGAGNDSIEGEAGDDILDGGPGRDVLLGGHGDDRLYSADAADVLLEGRAIAGSCDMCMVPCSPCPAQPICQVPVSQVPCPIPAPVEATCPPVTVAAPPVEAGCPSPEAKTLYEGERLQLHGTVSDSDCNIESVMWSVSAGSLDDPCSLHPVYTAPMIDGCEGIDVQVTLTAADSCGATASDAFILRVENLNHAPAIDAGRDLCVDEGTSVVLPAVGYDPDGDELGFRWVVTTGAGVFDDPSELNAVFTAPLIDDCDGTVITLTLHAVDACGATVCDSLVVKVRNVNRGPTVDLGPDFTMDEGCSTRLAPFVDDPDCDALQYRWSVTGGVLDRPNIEGPTYTAPLTNCCEGEMITLTLTVIDPCGLSATDSVCIYVRDVNGPPRVDLGPDFAINEGESIRLTPMIIDPDGDVLQYSWTTTGGMLTEDCIDSPIYTAPMTNVCEGIQAIITLTVVDPCGLTASDSVCVHIANVNRPPTVHADP